MKRTAAEVRDEASIDDYMLRELGLVEADEPTPFSHALWHEQNLRRLGASFTAEERRIIRLALGLDGWLGHP